MRGVFLGLIAAVGCAWALVTPAQLLWWGEYRLSGDFARDPSAQAWLFDHELAGHTRTPLFDYRLGSLEVDAGLFLTHGSINNRSDAAVGLGRTGLTLNLFPYRKFPLTLYYSRESRPELFGTPQWTNTILGARLILRTRWTGIWWINGERATLDQGGQTQVRRWLTVSQNRKFGRVMTDFSWRAEEWQTAGPQGWKRSTGTYNASMPLPHDGFLMSATVLQKEDFDAFSTSRAEERVLWTQRVATRWNLVGDASWHSRKMDAWQESGWNASSTLYRDFRSVRAFGGGAYGSTSVKDGSGAALRTSAFQGFGGATWLGPRGWSFTGDGAFGSTRQSGLDGASVTTQTLHFGLGKDQSLPSWISRLAYNFRDISFERRMGELYPPDYLPPEVQFLRQEYYETTRSGRGQFHMDLYHNQDSEGSKSDALSADGQLEFNHTLLLYTRADLRKESSSWSGDRDSQSLLLNARYRSRSHPYTVGLSLAYGRYSATPAPAVFGSHGTTQGDTWSLGASFSTVAWRRPWTANLLVINSSGAGTAMQFSLGSQIDVRDLHLRWYYFYDRDYNGWYRHRLYFDLLRLFRGNAL